jgi:hypothetical protein
VTWSEGLSNRAYITIRRYIDHAFMAVSFITFLHIPLVLFCNTVYIAVLLCASVNFVNYLFLLCILFVMYDPF